MKKSIRYSQRDVTLCESKNEISSDIIGEKKIQLAHTLYFQCTQNGHIASTVVEHRYIFTFPRSKVILKEEIVVPPPTQ